jgi:hypothetical protein
MENVQKMGVAALVLFFLLPKKSKASNSSNNLPVNSGGLSNGYTPVQGSPGTLDESYLGIASNGLNRGIRNNNPGNFKMNSAAWLDKVPPSQNTDGVFQQYYSFPFGVRMMIKELINNYIGGGHNTVQKIIDRYDGDAPQSYHTYVSDETGFGLNDVLTPNKETIRKVVQAITRFENGQTSASDPEVVLDETFDLAWTLI